MLSHTLTRTSSKSWFVTRWSCSLQKSSVINWSFIEYLLPLVGVISDDSNLIESGGNNCYLFISYIMSYTLKELIEVKENLPNMCGFEKLRFRYTGTVNPLLFATTIFCKLPEINWLAATNFHGQFLSTPFLSVHLHVYGKNWFVTRNIRNNEALRTSQKFLTHE